MTALLQLVGGLRTYLQDKGSAPTFKHALLLQTRSLPAAGLMVPQNALISGVRNTTSAIGGHFLLDFQRLGLVLSSCCFAARITSTYSWSTKRVLLAQVIPRGAEALRGRTNALPNNNAYN